MTSAHDALLANIIGAVMVINMTVPAFETLSGTSVTGSVRDHLGTLPRDRQHAGD
ncbi:hypothetical protein [Arthrobacter sp. ISL-69]|uniref:hypothetical protein n=1 Tax=Arthrobacter sp. ISL-69 TaxID=2819113 RepID=UPI001BE71688|nr:hypothetical protein [Arthrobacter sp. ISL-69]MBT2539035.1 hypothetical protein [Arthrobacter sp. ISL-69]